MLGVLRGGAISVSKFVSINDIPPLGYSMWQSLIAAILLIAMGYAKTRRLPSVIRNKRYFIFCALVGVAIPNVTFFYVVRSIPAGTMAVLLTLVPIVTYSLVVALRMERIDPVPVVGIVLGFGGALLIAMPQLSNGIAIDWIIVFAMLCPLGYASMSVFVSRYPMTDNHPFLLAGGTHMVAFLLLLPVAVWTDAFFPIWKNPGFVEALIVLHGVIAAVAYSLFFKIVELAGPVFYSFSTYIIAITGIGWGWVVFGESHHQLFWLAVVLIFAGLTIVNLRRNPRAAQSEV